MITSKLFYLFFFSMVLYSIIFIFKNYLSKLYPNYNPVQKIHREYVPPFGGIVIFTVFFTYIYFFLPNSILLEWYILFPSLLIAFVGLIEDLFGRATVTLRFFSILISSFIFVYVTENLPVIEIIFIGPVINDNNLIKIIFFSIALTALSNGTNMIDGMNGLCGFTLLSIVFGLLGLNYLNSNLNLLNEELIVLAVLIIIFLFLNFPYGKIFLGDMGAYWLGWIQGVIIIIIFSNSNHNTWTAALLVFYPIMEVIFSTIRKLFIGKNPLNPDSNHLHLKIFKTLKGPQSRRGGFNSFTTLCLMPFWSLPLLAVIWVHYFSHLAILFILLFSFIYIVFYIIMPNHD